MIKELRIKKFGKFTDTVFPFKRITLFVGPNEAGKTTLFDALLQCLAPPKGRHTQSDRLKRRYGEQRMAEILPSAAWPEMDPDQFLSVFAILSGKLDFDFTVDKSWLDKLKSKLFSGGVDPQALAAYFKKQAGLEKHRKANIELNRAETALAAELGELSILQKQMAEIESREKKIKSEQLTEKALAEAVHSLKESVVAMEREVEQQNKLKEKQSCLEALKNLTLKNELSTRLESRKNYSTDKTAELQAEKTVLDTLSNLVREKEIEQSHINSRFVEKKSELQKLELDHEIKRKAENTAERLLNQIKQGGENSAKTKTVLKTMLAVLGAGCIAAGFLSYLILGQIPALIAGLVAAIILLVLSVKLKYGGPSSQFMDSLKDLWFNSTGATLSSRSLEGITQELLQIRVIFNNLTANIRDVKQECYRCEQELTKKTEEVAGFGKDHRVKETELAKKLAALGVADLLGYAKGQAEYQLLRREYSETAGKIEQFNKTFAAADERILHEELKTRLTVLDGEIFLDKISEGEYQHLVKKLKALKTELEEKTRQQQELNKGIHYNSGSVAAVMKNLPHDIVYHEKTVVALQREIEELYTNREAALLNAQIFSEIAADSQALFQELSEQVAARYTALLPEARHVRLPGFAAVGMEIQDYGGAYRNVDCLSRGTQDAFYFAYRIALAEKLADGFKMLIFDEPFAAMDEKRSRRAAEFLKKFSKNNGWQIVLFTKDEMTEFGESTPDTVIHRIGG